MSRPKEPADAIIAVTHRCNARCVMCHLWKSDASDRLTPADMRKLPAALKTVNLSGGEPFLRDDLPQFVREVRTRCRRAQITISTNGCLPDRIAEQMREIRRIAPSVRLAVSLDGIGVAHDRIRGLSGAFDRAVDLIDRLTAEGYRGLRLAMTISRGNLDQVPAVAQLADRLGLELGIVAAHAAETHLGVRTDDVSLGQIPTWLAGAFANIIARWLRSWRPKHWLRAHFTWYTYSYLAGRPFRRQSTCRDGSEFFFLQADGTVYSCSVRGRAMGNVVDQDWAEIWCGPAAEAARQFAFRCPLRCWMICTARSVYRAHPLRVAAWVAWRKMLAHLRLFRLKGSVGSEET